MIDTIERPTISTARLALRPVAVADAPRIANLANDFDVVKTTGGMPFPYGLADAEAYLARCSELDPARETVFAIDAAGEGLVGLIGFHDTGELAPEVGYWLGKPYWGRGFATETLKGAMAWTRDAWRRRSILACHHLDNPASGRVLSRAGFLYTGRVELKPCRARGEDVLCRWMAWLA
jgi:RimJ/RimL family protein N-acetyltransferase